MLISESVWSQRPQSTRTLVKRGFCKRSPLETYPRCPSATSVGKRVFASRLCRPSRQLSVGILPTGESVAAHQTFGGAVEDLNADLFSN